MRPYQLFFIFVFLFFACNRGLDVTDNTDYTPTPGSTSVNTKFAAYLFPVDPPPGDFSVNNQSLPYIQKLFTSGTLLTDKFNTRIEVSNNLGGSYLNNYRVIPVTSSSRNYIDAKVLERHHVGFIASCCGDIWPLPAGGTIEYPDNSFSATISTGFVGAYASYLNPTVNDFSIAIPGSFADFDNKRWWLRSFGAVRIDYNQVWSIKPGADVKLTLPIPQAMLADAPDSIEAWHFTNFQWEKKGYAKKINNSYRKVIDKQGMWNFARPVNGKYINLKIHTVNNIPVHNAVVKIKNQGNEVAGGRTDADGTFFCFVPTNIPLDLTVMYGVSFEMFSRSLGTIISSGDHDITVPVNTTGLASFQGSVKDCNNNPVKNATISVIKYPDNVVVAYVPVVNGTYSSAIPETRILGGSTYLMRIVDDAGTVAAKDTGVVLHSNKLDTINLNSCATSTALFINYTVDGTPYSLTGNAATPFSPMLAGYPGSPGTNYYCTSGAIGMQFTVNGGVPGTYPHVYDLWVNNGYYQRDLSKPCTITITRYDLNVGGYIQGTFDFYYKDAQNISHRVVGSFRVKRIT